ncbi:MAG: zinc metalloprotease HtpX [Thermoanaerobaculia bacterium]
MNNQIKTIVLMGALSAILIGIGAVMGKGYVALFTLIAIALNFGAYFFSDKLVQKMHGAREVSEAEAPALHRLVSELSVAAGIPMPRVLVVDSPQPNAFATGRNPENGAVAVTTGIVGTLTERELRGVIAHELAHIRNRDVLVATIAAAIAGAVTLIANVLQWSAIFGGSDDEDAPSPLAMIALAFVAPIAVTLVQLGISRSREYMADETGARISGDPSALASALEKLQAGAMAIAPANPRPATASLFIVNPLAGAGGLMELFSTHPPMAERISRLRAMAWRGEGMAA